MSDVRTAFVFAGGGSLGAVEVGMLKALVAADIRADLVTGASAGAINAAYFAALPEVSGVAALERIWRGLHTANVFPVSPWRSLLSLAGRAPSLVDPTALREVLEAHLPYRRLEETMIVCHLVATDVREGTEVGLAAGPAVDALMASAAIPGVFPPVTIDGRLLIDGGVAANTPIASAVSLGATRIIVLPTGFSCALTDATLHPLALAVHALNLMIARQLRSDVEHFRDRCRIVVVPPLCPVEVTPYDFSAAGELIDRAYVSTRAWLAGGGLAVEDVPHELVPHTHI